MNMATQLEVEEEYTEDAPDLDLEGDDEPVEQDNAPDEEDSDEPAPTPEAEDEVDVIGWGQQEVAGEEESEGVRSLRKRLREREDELRALKGQPKVEEVGPRPSLDEFDFDEDAHADAVEKWVLRRNAAKDRETQADAAARKQRERWEAQARDLDTGYTDLRAPGKDSARAKVEEAFPGEQFAYVVKAAGKNAAAFIYALGNAPDKMEELKAHAADGSWAEFIASAAVMAKEVNVQRRKPVTQPERERGGGTVGVNGGADSRHAKLLREAEGSGDYSALIAYEAKMGKK